MLILYEKVYRNDHFGWKAFHCDHCRGIRPIKVESVIEVEKLYFIPCRSKAIRMRLQCYFCDAEQYIEEIIEPGSDAGCDVNWTPERPLQELVDSTFPGHVVPVEQELPTGKEMKAILSCLDYRTKAKVRGSGGFGGLLGLAVAAGCTWTAGQVLLWELPMYLWVCIPSGLIGLLTGIFLERYRTAKSFAKREIKSILSKHHFCPATLAQEARIDKEVHPVIPSLLTGISARR